MSVGLAGPGGRLMAGGGNLPPHQPAFYFSDLHQSRYSRVVSSHTLTSLKPSWLSFAISSSASGSGNLLRRKAQNLFSESAMVSPFTTVRKNVSKVGSTVFGGGLGLSAVLPANTGLSTRLGGHYGACRRFAGWYGDFHRRAGRCGDFHGLAGRGRACRNGWRRKILVALLNVFIIPGNRSWYFDFAGEFFPGALPQLESVIHGQARFKVDALRHVCRDQCQRVSRGQWTVRSRFD